MSPTAVQLHTESLTHYIVLAVQFYRTAHELEKILEKITFSSIFLVFSQLFARFFEQSRADRLPKGALRDKPQ